MEQLHHATSGAPEHQKPERQKTEGEERFDWWIYGGIGWVVNAIVSVFITDQLYNNKTPLIDTKEGKISIKQWFQNGENWLKQQKWNVLEEKFPGFTKKAVFGGSLCIGGSLVVPVIKWFEDRKGKIVRKWDEEFYGPRANTDPDIVQAHKDMDNAPKQSWGSLLGARLTVVGIAFGMGPTIGDYNSVSGKALGNVPILKHFSSFEGFGASCARAIGHGYDWMRESVLKLGGKPLMDKEVAKLHPLKVQTQGVHEEHRALKVAEITGYELTQSASIAALFYAISKAFAGAGHKPEEGRKAPPHIPTTVTSPGHRDMDAPSATVSDITHDARMEQALAKSEPSVAA